MKKPIIPTPRPIVFGIEGWGGLTISTDGGCIAPVDTVILTRSPIDTRI